MKKIKEFKPSYIVDLDEIKHLDDIECVFAMAKQNAGLAITDDELMSIIEWAVNEARPNIYICDMRCKCEKKPWYKRFWNWLTRKNKK